MTDFTAIDSFGKWAANTAMYGAVDYIKNNSIELTDAQYDEVTVALRKHLKAAIPSALKDAKAAMGCGMTNVAQQTTEITFTLAGIAAAKEVFC